MGDGVGFGVSRHKPLYIGWVDSTVPLQSIGNCIQYPGVSRNGKEYEKVYRSENVSRSVMSDPL